MLSDILQMVQGMTNGPYSAADAEQFYRTLQRFATTALDNPADPWKALPDVEPDHRKVIEKLVSWAPEHRNEVAAYLHKAVFLVGQTKQPRLSLVRSPETPS